MKLRPLVLVTVPLVFSHCAPIDDGGGATTDNPAPGLPRGHKPYSGPHRGTYELGMNLGRSDASGGQPRQPSRHYGNFPATETNAFNRGYQAGYSLATRPGPSPSRTATTRPVPPQAADLSAPAPGPLIAERSAGTVTLRRGGEVVSVCRTAGKNVEQARFIDGQRQIAVRSRDNQGPAVVQLFNTATGQEVERIMAYQIRGGFPQWGLGLGE